MCAHLVQDAMLLLDDALPVSYTHLDVYKRQVQEVLRITNENAKRLFGI